MKTQIEEDQLILCTVRKIEGTTVFVDIEGGGHGTIVMSEIAAGRIRNIRDYVYPNKKIVCKVLRVAEDHIELTFRRVTGKERDEVIERYQKEKTFLSILKTSVKEPEKVIEKINENYELSEVFDRAREEPEVIKPFVSKEEFEKLSKILLEKREKEKEAKKIFVLKSFAPDGLEEIKEMLKGITAEVHYLGSSQFSIETKAKDFKDANHALESALGEIAKRAKAKSAQFELAKEK